MNEANDFTGFLTKDVNMNIPRKLISKPNTKELGGGDTFDTDVIEGGGLNQGKGHVFSGNDHAFSFGGICREVVTAKPCIDDVDV